MWLQLILFAWLGLALLCGSVKIASHYYLELLQRVFAYTSEELQQVRQERKQRLRAKQQEQQQPKRIIKLTSGRRVKPRKDALNARMEQCCDLIADGLRLVLEDEVTPRFAAAEPPAEEWNLLTRNLRMQKRQLSWRLLILWFLGLILRYAVLVPVRVAGCAACLLLTTLLTALMGQLPDWEFKRRLVQVMLRQCFRLANCFIPVLRRVHNPELRSRLGICVCNHTSPMDVLVLMCDIYYSLTGQRHSGILGIIQRALGRASPHLWFDRRELNDREALSIVLCMHAKGDNMPPILLFPEGTCINNTAVLRFRKGSFAISNVVYPMAVRYDRRFGDAFWDSTRFCMLRYIVLVISSWATLCDVWYLPAMKRRASETAIEFSNRVQAAVAAQAGMEDLPFDGNLKRCHRVRDWQ